MKETEVVINKCFGGFGLSHKALLLLIKRKVECVRKIKIEDYYGKSKNYKKKFKEDFKGCKKLGDGFYSFTFCNNITDKEFVYDFIDCGDCEHKMRADPELIKVVKELGEEANGDYAELTIVKVPKGAEWTIEEYDGLETVEEAHKIFG